MQVALERIEEKKKDQNIEAEQAGVNVGTAFLSGLEVPRGLSRGEP